ncbi:MAG: type II secretion system protein [Phycisphaerae bacterium]
MKMRVSQVVARSGFTLIELLVVIAIIALLMSILMPALGRAREQARLTRCMVHLRGVAQAHHTYALENNDYIPGERGVADPDHRFDWEKTPVSTGWLAEDGALPDPKIWLCPSDRRPTGVEGDHLHTYSYTLNGRTGVAPGEDGKRNPRMIDGAGGHEIRPRRLSTFPNTADYILAGEENTGTEEGYLINDPRFTNEDISEGRHLGDQSAVGYIGGGAGTIPPDINLWNDPDYWPVPLEE